MPAPSVVRSFVRFTVLLFALVAFAARAEVAVNITYLDSAGEGFFDTAPRSAVAGNSGTTLGEQRRNAFETAVYHWSKMLNGNVAIRISAVWLSQGTSTLASATPLTFASDWSGVPVAGRYYPGALANQLAGLDHDPTNDDIQVMCNPDWDDGSNAGAGDPRKWYYGTDGNPPSGDFDFYSTMLHELGHGLGFLSFLNTDGTWQNGAPTIYDNFLANGSGTWVSSLSQSQRAAIVTSANLFSAGSTTTSVNYDQWARIYAPTTFNGGSSLSHLDEATFSTTGNIDECMTPVSSFATHSIGPVATALFRDMGYSFVDNKAPTVAITLPANGSSRSGLTLASGTATDTSSTGDAGATGLREVRVTLARNSDGKWYNWLADTWGSTTYDPNTNIKKAGASIVPISKGERSWAIALPTLADGSYEIQVQAVDQMNLGSSWVKSTFTMDRSAPSISFDPLQTNDVVFNFADIGGLVNEATSVSYAIYDITDSPSRFWNGSGWSTFGISYLPGTITGNQWGPADMTQLPPRSAIRMGTYALYAKAYDAASNSITATITVTRSAADTTLPDGTITSPATNQIITTRSLPTLAGTAYDAESGIGSISLYLLRLADSGFLYWDGSVWTETPSALAVNYDAVGATWQSAGSLPGGSNLPNGNYQVQVSLQNGENPAGTRGVSSLFVVDYHPTYTWTEGSYRDGVAGNDNQEFNNPANWNPYGVPPADALVVINSGLCDASLAGSLSLWGVNISGSGTLTTPGLFVKKLNVSAGTLNGGAVNIDGENGVFNWTGGTVNGTLGILAGAVANVSGGSSKTLGTAAILNNSGTINWSGTGSFYAYAYDLADRAAINNLSNAVFNVQNDGYVFNSTYNRSIFNNAAGARFIKNGGTGSVYANGFDFNNAGEIRCEAGTMVFNTILNVTDGSRFSGTGSFLFQSGTASFAGDLLIDASYFKMESGTLDGAADLVLATTNGGLFEWSGGTIRGTLEIAPNTSFNISSGSTKTIASRSRIRNRGNIVWSGSGNVDTYAYDNTERAAFRNMIGASFSISGTGRFNYIYTPSVFNNEAGATVLKSGAGTSGFDWVFNNDGVVQCHGGTLFFNSGGSSAGSFTTDAGTIIKFGGGVQTLNDGAELFGAGTFQIQTGNLRRNGVLHVGGSATSTLELLAGTFDGNGVLTGNAMFNWSGGTIAGQLDLGANITANVTGSSEKTIASESVINNGGTFNWGGSGNLYTFANDVTNRATFNNLSNAVFSISGTGRFSYTYTPSIFNNEAGATVLKSGAGTSGFDWVFNNDGVVQCHGGTLFFNSGGSSAGSFTTDAGTIIKFGGGVQTLNDGAELFGAGTFQIQTGNLRRNGVLHVGGSATSTLELLAGTFDGNGVLTGNAIFNWSGGTIAGQLDLGTNITSNVIGSSEKTIASESIINNGGTFNWGGSGNFYTYAYGVTNRATFNNLSNAVFTITSNAVFSMTYTPSVFNNYEGATLTKTAGSGTTRFDWVFNSFGTVRCSSGTMSFAQGGNSGGSYAADTNAIIQFSGGVHTLTNATALNGAGKIQITYGTVHHLGDIQTGTADVPATLELFSGAAFKGSGALNGVCTFNWNGGRIGDGLLDVAPTVTFNASGYNEKELASETTFNNAGTFNWFGNGAIYCFAYDATNRSCFNNLPGAIFDLKADGSAFSVTYSASVFTNHPGALLLKSGGLGSSTLSAFDFENFGDVRVETGTLIFGSKLNLNPSSVFTGSGTVKLTGTTTLATDLNSSCHVILESGSFTGLKNALPVPTLSGVGAFTWTGGYISGALTINSNVTFAVSGSSEKLFSSETVLDNYGHVEWTGTGNLYVHAGEPTNAAAIFNRSGATWNWGSDAGFTYAYWPSTFNNEAGAVFRKSGGTGTANCSWTFNNQGSLVVESGNFGLQGASSMASSASTTLSLGGTVSGSGYSQLVRPGALSLAGDLHVVLKNGFVPTNGNSFNLVTYTSRNGEFGSVTLPTLPVTSTWKLAYGASALTAQVVAVPLIGNAVKLGDGSFQFTVTGETASSAIVEASTDLIQWLPISTNAPFTGSWDFSDPQAANHTNRFYRLIIIP